MSNIFFCPSCPSSCQSDQINLPISCLFLVSCFLAWGTWNGQTAVTVSSLWGSIVSPGGSANSLESRTSRSTQSHSVGKRALISQVDHWKRWWVGPLLSPLVSRTLVFYLMGTVHLAVVVDLRCITCAGGGTPSLYNISTLAPWSSIQKVPLSFCKTWSFWGRAVCNRSVLGAQLSWERAKLSSVWVAE